MAKWTIEECYDRMAMAIAAESESKAGYDLSEHMEEEISARGSYTFIPEGKPVDNVNNPDHYNTGSIECIEYLQDNMSWEGFTGYLEGNCKKYMHRWRYKTKPLEDLKKARWYLDRLIEELEGPDE
jgi:hypothetical protein